MLRKFLPGRNPIGETVTFVEAPPRTIVGVVSDAVTYPCVMECGRLSTYRWRNAMLEVAGRRSTSAFVRPRGRPPCWHLVWRLHLTAVDRNLTFTFRPLQDRVDASLTQERLVALLTGFFGALALLLAGLGLWA